MNTSNPRSETTRVREEARRNLEPAVNDAVAKIFAQYPHRAAP